MVEYKEAQISHLKSTNQTNRRQYISLPLSTSAALREADLPAAGLASDLLAAGLAFLAAGLSSDLAFLAAGLSSNLAFLAAGLASDLLAAGLASDLAFLTLLPFADATNEHATIAHTYSNDNVHSKTASAITQPNEYTTHVTVTHL